MLPPQKDILSDHDGMGTFRNVERRDKVMIQYKPGTEFLRLVLRHVHPKRFCRARDAGVLHGNCSEVL
jgi:hypothetical protein